MNSPLIQTDRFALSETERSAIEHEMHHYEDPRAASIEALKIVQKERGWVPDGAIYAIGDLLGIPASDVEGVATFTARSSASRSDVTSFASATAWSASSAATKTWSTRSRAHWASAWVRPPLTVASPCCRSAASAL